jgi:membrane fusion protein (multidrug efflux system)
MKKWILLLIIAAILLTGCSREKKGKEEPIHSKGALRVLVSPVKKGNVGAYIKYSGITKGIKEISLGPGISTFIDRIYVVEGQRVSRGQLVARLSVEQLNQAKANLNMVKDNYERMKKLHEQGSIPDAQFEQVKAAYQNAKALYESASKNIELRAPFSGIIGSVIGNEGEFYNAMMGGRGIVTLIDLSSVRLELEVSDRDIPKVMRGMTVNISFDSYPDTLFSGIVNRVDQIADPRSGTYTVEVKISNPKMKLKSGMYADAMIIIESAESVVTVPLNAVLGDSLVFVAKDRKALSRKIVVGVKSEDLVEIKEGLSEGELVVTSGTIGLFDGAPISYSVETTD